MENLLLVFFIFILIQVSKCNEDSKIVFVYEYVRHGARSPLFADGNTEYIDHFGTKWEGPALLTLVGRREHYVIGIQNRKKYSSLINFDKFDINEIQIYTTNTGRTIQSIQAELQAMYLPGTLEKLSNEQLAVALPPIENLPQEVITEAETLDNETIIYGINVFPIQFVSPTKYLLNKAENCPYMAKYQEELVKKSKKRVDEFLKENDQKFGEQLQKFLNKPNRDFMYDFDFVELYFADEVISNHYDGNNFTDFINQTDINITEFLEYNKESKNIYIFHQNIDEKAGVMAASPQMKDLINYMDDIINNKDKAPKMIIVGGHDNTMNCILYFMQYAFNIPIEFIPFAATVYFELHKNGTNDYYVEYIFDGKSLLTLDYNIFKNKVLEKIWSEEQINNFCYPDQEDQTDKNGNNSDNKKYKKATLILCITNGIFFVLTLVFLFLFIHYRKKSKTSLDISTKNEPILAEMN